MNSNEVYAILMNIKMANLTNDKIAMLKQCDSELLRKVLYSTYNKDRYYVVKGLDGVIGTGTRQFNETTWKLLRLMNLRHPGFNAAYGSTIVNQYIRELTPESAQVFKWILNKTVSFGLAAKGINKAFPGLIPTFDVMLAEKFDESRLSFPCYAEPKIDGDRGLYRDGVFYTRSGRVISGLHHLTPFLKKIGAPALDGELLVPNLPQAESSGIIRSNGDKSRVWFHVFDLPDSCLSYVERREKIKKYGSSFFTYNIRIVPCKHVTDYKRLIGFYKVCLSNGYEGVMVKTSNHLYQNKRSFDWMKMKEIHTVDLWVDEVVGGQGKYKDLLGYAVCAYKGKNVHVGGGWSDEEREKWRPIRYGLSDLVGRRIEVAYQEETKDGSLRHPRFIRVRHDL